MKKEKNRVITRDGLWDVTDLNDTELKYFKIMLPKSGILFLKSKPGIGKSATARSIANKVIHVPTGENLRYIDLRLAMLDETDVGLFPKAKELDVEYVNEKGERVKSKEDFLTHIVPEWAKIANEGPTIIHFEELNRAPQAVRNAALQILLEREIGYKFKFNPDVFMLATGNLGEADGTEVEEFDSALNGRLIHFQHKMNYPKWVEYYAAENVHDSIVKFLKIHGEHYYTDIKNQTDAVEAYASPRTWTFLSDYIHANYGKGCRMTNEIASDIANVGNGYVGPSFTSFLRYIRDVLKINIDDIIRRFPQLKKEGATFSRDKKSELLSDLKERDMKKLKKNEIENVKLFLLDLGKDEVTAFLLKLIDDDYEYDDDSNVDEKNNEFILGFLRDKRFKAINKAMQQKINKDNDTDSF